jgi:hypothetical protein
MQSMKEGYSRRHAAAAAGAPGELGEGKAALDPGRNPSIAAWKVSVPCASMWMLHVYAAGWWEGRGRKEDFFPLPCP